MLHPGLVLGERFEIREQLGRGGMGVVWLAHDLKLRVDVALKAIRPDQLAAEKRRELLRAEVRAARDVLSPNVCRVFDLVVEGDHELVSMEYVDGVTLADLLEERGPFDLAEARDIASQFLAGLEAVHQAGLVHRDFKPENVMVTGAGRVVVMDLGIAQKAEDPSGTIVGTPAYMAPEQSGGGDVDARADVFAAGVALAEMTASGGAEERRALLDGLRDEPPRVPDGPWSGVIRRAVSRRAPDRYASARELSRALDSVTLRVVGENDRMPYPGLSAFTEPDAGHFFGREAEVEAMLRKLSPAARVLAVAGPSGAGKSSFVRAGVIPALPEDCRAVALHPRDRPFAALAQALLPELSGDNEGLSELLRIEEPEAAISAARRWRRRHGRALVVLDQFEELFTLCPPEVQARFAQLLGRLPLEADVHVLISMRDDFLGQAAAHEALAPVASDLTLLQPPTGAALRRALVQPALGCGYRFEDEALAGEMLRQVEKERGALPLLAFAAARLWEERDREEGLLTRAAYESIGGVAGALALHAEATLRRLGPEGEPIVRELFRNLVTAQGTRAIRDRDDLLSVFEHRAAAEPVLQALVDARLLTAFEVAGDGAAPSTQRVEIVHESLLQAWPRLVRWRTQDAGGAQLRDQLRQVARVWEDRGRPTDLLWTGPSYREFEVWRERYGTRLSGGERAFAEAMARLAGQHRRRRRAALAAAFAALLTIAVGAATLWQRSEGARLRAEASRLVALGRAELSEYPTGAFAYALKALETQDLPEARRLVLEALYRGPLVSHRPLELESATHFAFSPDGEWLALGDFERRERNVELVPRDGGPSRLLTATRPEETNHLWVRFSPAGDRVLAGTVLGSSLQLWSFPGLEAQPGIRFSGRFMFLDTERLLTLDLAAHDSSEGVLEEWRFSTDGEPTATRLGTVPMDWRRYDTTGDWFVRSTEEGLFRFPVRTASVGPGELVGGEPGRGPIVGPGGNLVGAHDDEGEFRIWSPASGPDGPVRILDPSENDVGFKRFSRDGTWILERTGDVLWTWDLSAPVEASRPQRLATGGGIWRTPFGTEPESRWLVAPILDRVAFFPLERRQPLVLEVGESSGFRPTPDGRGLVGEVRGRGRALRYLALDPDGPESRLLIEGDPNVAGLSPGGVAVDPAGRFVVYTDPLPGVPARVVPLDGGPPTDMPVRLAVAPWSFCVAVGPEGRLVAAAPGSGPPDQKVIRIWDTETGDVRVLGPADDAGQGSQGGYWRLAFDGDDGLLSFASGVLRRWDLESGESRVLNGGSPSFMADMVASRDGRWILTFASAGDDTDTELRLYDRARGHSELVTSHGRRVSAIAFDDHGSQIVTGSQDGTVRVGPIGPGEPHLLVTGAEGVNRVSVTPDGRWIASTHMREQVVRLWPMPEGDPLHTLPLDALLAKLRTLTNIRVVEDGRGGYEKTLDPFPGWGEVPVW